MQLSARDHAALEGVHPDLVRVMHTAAPKSFLIWRIQEGVRTPARQRQLFDARRTLTLDSAHIARPIMIDGVVRNVGLAVDVVLLKAKQPDWVFEHYAALAAECLETASRLRIPLRWGGHFRDARGRRFADGLHFELDRDFYPRAPI